MEQGENVLILTYSEENYFLLSLISCWEKRQLLKSCSVSSYYCVQFEEFKGESLFSVASSHSSLMKVSFDDNYPAPGQAASPGAENKRFPVDNFCLHPSIVVFSPLGTQN